MSPPPLPLPPRNIAVVVVVGGVADVAAAAAAAVARYTSAHARSTMQAINM